MEKLKVISLFDGMSCGRLALHNLGIEVESYLSSEIDKDAMHVANKNFPDIIQLGDVTKVNGRLLDIDLLIGGSPCFIAGTKVISEDGYKNIEDIRVGDYVFTHKKRFKKVLRIGSDSKEIYKLTGQGFFNLFSTKNHPFYISTRIKEYNKNTKKYNTYLTNPEWKNLEFIKKGDYVGLPIIDIEENLLNLSEQECWLLGRYLADGHTRKDYRKRGGRYYQVIFSIGDNKLDHFNHIIEYNVSKYQHTSSTHRFVIYSKKLVNIIDSIGIGHGAINKKIPIEILKLPKNLLRIFLDGYMSGDGCDLGHRYKASSISKELIMGLNLIIAKVYNTNSSFEFTKKPDTYIIEGRVVNQRDLYTTEFRKEMKKQSKAVVKDGFIWLPIKKIEELLYTQQVFNLEVEDDNSYTANNITVHNCQGFSFNGKQLNFEDERSKLIFEFIRIKNEVMPKYFLLENVNMADKYRDIITDLIGVQPYRLDSKYFSACKRNRYYWTNIPVSEFEYNPVTVGQIREYNIMDDKYYLTEKQKLQMKEFGAKNNFGGKVINDYEKFTPILASYGKGSGNGGKLIDAKGIRIITPKEAEILHGLPIGYTEGLSDAKRYKLIGNGWSIPVIEHIFKHLLE